MRRRVLIVLAMFVALAVAGLAIFLVTLNVDRYRPLVMSQLEQALRRPVRLERMHLAWHGGVVVTLQQVAIGQEQAAADEPFVEAESIDAVVAWRPLLKKHVEIDSLRIRDGSVRWNGRRVDHLSAEAMVRPDRLEIRSLRAEFAGGTLQGSGTVEQFSTTRLITFDVSADSLQLDALVPRRAPEDPHLAGILSVSCKGTARGGDPAMLMQSASGSGTVSLAHWKVVNLNILREVFERLSMLPGLVERLQSRLPASYAEKLQANDTVFEPLDLPVTIDHGTVRAADVRLTADSFELQGVGQVRFNVPKGALVVPSTLRIDPELSAALVRSVQELQSLADANGRLEIPLMIQGTLPQISVLPDLQYVASRVLVTKAQALLGNFLQRALEKQ